MLFLFVILGAAIVAVLVWRTLGAEQAPSEREDRPWEPAGRPASPPRASGPDDDPEFLRRLDERAKRRDDDPPAG